MKEHMIAKERVHFNLARLKKHGVEFEVPVHPELAMDFRNGKDVDIRDIVEAQDIFSDSQKGELAKEDDLQKVFGTTDPLEVARELVLHGELQLTQKIREEFREKKRKKIVSLIALHAIDPQSNLPHPPARIESAMEQAKVKIDEFKSAEDQLEGIVKSLRPIMPIKIATKRLRIHIPAQYTGKAYGVVKGLGELHGETWTNQGHFECTIEIPAGLVTDVYEKLNHATESEVSIEELE